MVTLSLKLKSHILSLNLWMCGLYKMLTSRRACVVDVHVAGRVHSTMCRSRIEEKVSTPPPSTSLWFSTYAYEELSIKKLAAKKMFNWIFFTPVVLKDMILFRWEFKEENEQLNKGTNQNHGPKRTATKTSTEQSSSGPSSSSTQGQAPPWPKWSWRCSAPFARW